MVTKLKSGRVVTSMSLDPETAPKLEKLAAEASRLAGIQLRPGAVVDVLVSETTSDEVVRMLRNYVARPQPEAAA